MDRRKFLTLSAAGGGAIFMSGLMGTVHAASVAEDFYFVQLSDAHWGYSGPANPAADVTLKKAVASVNALEHAPDFIMFTGDLTQTTDDPVERRQRMREFRDIISQLKVKPVYFIPGEHDAALDNGEAFKEFFGKTYYSFDHKGIHFIALDNVSLAGSKIGAEQLEWLKSDLAQQAKDAPIVVFTHRPLFDLAPAWDWATRDGADVMNALLNYSNVTVFYGHIHHEHHFKTEHINHYAATSLIFALPEVGSQEKKAPIPWDANIPFKGLGFREVDIEQAGHEVELAQYSVAGVARQGA